MSISKAPIYDFAGWIDLAPEFDWNDLAPEPEPESDPEPEPESDPEEPPAGGE